MNRALTVGIALALLLVAPACGFYFGGDDDPCDVDFGGGDSAGAQAEPAPTGLLNPDTGQCEFFGNPFPPPFPCDSECGPCVGGAEQPPDAVPQPSWGFCESFCTGLDEATCLDTSGCRAGYVDGGDDPDVFSDCWMTDQGGPIQGDCTGLDAYSCSLHDDCKAIHTNACDPNGDKLVPACLGAFSQCQNETGGVDPGNCFDEVLCDGPTPECPPNTLPGVKDGCYTGFCIPLDQCESQVACSAIGEEVACVGRADCTALYEGVNCSCDANGCDCVDWTFDTCEAGS
jgi:hypothetical protein